jgi:hypothetical protein
MQGSILSQLDMVVKCHTLNADHIQKFRNEIRVKMLP